MIHFFSYGINVCTTIELKTELIQLQFSIKLNNPNYKLLIS